MSRRECSTCGTPLGPDSMAVPLEALRLAVDLVSPGMTRPATADEMTEIVIPGVLETADAFATWLARVL